MVTRVRDRQQAICRYRKSRSSRASPPLTQRYIRRSLDIGLERDDAIARWSRDMVEETAIRVQARGVSAVARNSGYIFLTTAGSMRSNISWRR